jgi:hypothetical protein
MNFIDTFLRIGNYWVSLAIGKSRQTTSDLAAGEQNSNAKRDQARNAIERVDLSLRKAHSDREYDVFVSYRRDKGSEVARFLAEKLQARGYRVFLDVESLGVGEWGMELKRRIEECPDFVAIVSDGFFVRCERPDDVVRKEIAHALLTKATMVPLLIGPSSIPSDLPDDIQGISAHNGIRYLHEYADQAVERLCQFLSSTPLLGPERLSTGESQPRVILMCVLMSISIFRGAQVGEHVGYSVFWVDSLFGLGFGLLAVLLVLLPAMLALTVYGNLSNIRRDSLYAGPWTSFWGFAIVLAFFATSVFVSFFQGLIGIRSYFLGGLLGGAVALLLTRTLIETDLWQTITRAIGIRKR